MVFYKPAPALKPIKLPGGNLQLRVPQPQDYLAWKHIRETSREFLVPWEPSWPDDDLTRFGYRRRLKRYTLEREMKTGETYFLVSTEENIPMGGISLSNIRYGVARMCNIGYWMGEKYASKGYMSMAVDGVSVYIFEELKLCRIEAACLLHNKRSSRLLEGAGFKREGILRKYLEINGTRQDHVLYALLREDRQSAALGR